MSAGRAIIRVMTWWGRVRGWARARLTAQFSGGYTPVADLITDLASRVTRVSRAEALSVPAVQRGRNMLCSISTLPLVQYGPDNAVIPNPLLKQIDPDVPNVVTLAMTVEDLLFESIAWWRITGLGFDGYPVSAQRLDPCVVSLNPPNVLESPLPSLVDPHGAVVVYVNGQPVPADQMIRFDSPNPAVLVAGARAIRKAVLIDKAAAMYSDDPRPLDYFSPAEGADPVDDDDVAQIIGQWRAARKRRATGWVPASLKYNTVDSPSPADLQLVELQKQASLDLANALGLDPEDLGVSTTSRTYANAVDRRIDKINEVKAPLMSAITDRLSMGDVTKRGYRIEFNLNGYLKANPTERWATYKTAIEIGVMDVEEIRAAEGLTPGAPETPTPPAAPPIQATVGRPVRQLAATAATFDGPAHRFVDLPLESFSVDSQTRIIEGIALPYGKAATKYGISVRFEKGALQFGEVGRIKLLRDHDPSQAVGVAMKLTDSTSGFTARFKVARGAAGDDVLALAEDGVLDGLSVGVDFNEAADTVPDPRYKGGILVRRADLREVSLTAMPAFDDARVTKVAASLTGGSTMEPCTTCGQIHAEGVACSPATPPTPPAAVPAQATPATFTADQLAAAFTALGFVPQAPAAQPPAEPRQFVNPTTRPLATATVREAVPYRFQRHGVFDSYRPGDNVFSADLHAMVQAGDDGSNGGTTDAAKRVMGLINATFARREFVITTDVDELNPTLQRPDLYVDQRDFRYPIYTSIDRGAPPNGLQPFAFPKFSSSGSLVGDHVEGTEPGAGTFVTTSQTITPTPVSGKARITRETWDMGGNPAVSTLIFNQMVRGYKEGLESAAATFLNTLTAATDINLGVAATDAAFTASWEAAVAALQFVRSYQFDQFVVDQTTYLKAAGARDTTGRAFYPQIAPMNANGTAEPRFAQLNMAGVLANPSWALPSTPGSPNNSWLYDSMCVWGFSTAPQRLEFAGSGAANIYSPVAFVDLAIWGYKAFANTDIGGVRQVIYDSV